MKIFNSLLIVGLVILVLGSCSPKTGKQETVNTGQMLQYCVKKTHETIGKLAHDGSLPRNILMNQTEWNNVDIHDWTSGFWPGVLWYAYEASGDSSILTQARNYTNLLEGVLEVPVDNHDLGFMLFCSYGNGYRLTKDTVYRNFILKAADSLATLFNPKIGTILSWPAMRQKMNWPHNTIVDNLINLELLFWSSKNGGKKEHYDIAVSHAKTCMSTLIRPDFTTYHVAVFDTVDGHFIKGVTHQGYADNSLWARGQGWGIYGYSMCYRETGDVVFLETAKKLADVFISRLPEDGIPYWDFDDPAIPNSPKDASAAAVVASGLLEMSGFMTDVAEKEKYRNAAISLLAKLSSPDYLSGDKNPAFLIHSTGHYPKGTEIDASIIYADYYYIEALLRLKQIDVGVK